MVEKALLYRTAKEVFEETITLILGPSECRAICFHLEQRIGRDPYEVLVEEPKTFYEEFKKLFSIGANVLLNWVGKCLMNKYGIGCSPEEFVNILYRSDESSKDKMMAIMAKIHEKSKKEDAYYRNI